MKTKYQVTYLKLHNFLFVQFQAVDTNTVISESRANVINNEISELLGQVKSNPPADRTTLIDPSYKINPRGSDGTSGYSIGKTCILLPVIIISGLVNGKRTPEEVFNANLIIVVVTCVVGILVGIVTVIVCCIQHKKVSHK